MPHDTNYLHVQNESTSAHPIRLLSSPGLKMGQTAALASTLPERAASFVTALVSEQHRTWLHNVPERGTFSAQTTRDKYITTRVNKVKQHLITISEQCIVAMILVIPRVPHDTGSRFRIVGVMHANAAAFTAIGQDPNNINSLLATQRARLAPTTHQFHNLQSPVNIPEWRVVASRLLPTAMVFFKLREKKTTSTYNTVLTVLINYFSGPSKSLKGSFALTSRA